MNPQLLVWVPQLGWPVAAALLAWFGWKQLKDVKESIREVKASINDVNEDIRTANKSIQDINKRIDNLLQTQVSNKSV